MNNNRVLEIKKRERLKTFKEELELKIHRGTMKSKQVHQNIEIPDFYEGLEMFIEKNGLTDKMHILKCAGESHDLLFKQIVDVVKPRIIIEAGSYVGYSACKFAEYNKLHKKHFAIICIDNWLSVWYKENWESKLFGQPTLYYSFLKNIKDQGHTDVVIPYQQDTLRAYYNLKKLNISGDVIYIDAAHDELSVYIDFMKYYELLNPRGILFGDDWAWESVRMGVLKACDELNIKSQLEVTNGCWIIQGKKM